MKKNLFITVLLSLNAFSAFAIDWQNPPVMCPEEILSKGLPCPDFSHVDNVYTDYPDDMTSAQINDWKNNKAADLRLCRNAEVMRREKNKPGSYSKATIENAWMIVNSGEKVKEKLDAIQTASVKYKIPSQVLMGAMRQESLLATIGLSPDGGNYSCGMSQLNITEWCAAMNSKSAAEKIKLGWPESINCDELPTDIVKPFYDIAVKKLGTRAGYELTAKDFEGITQEQIDSAVPKKFKSFKIFKSMSDDKFQAATSFVKHCQDIDLSVDFKARTLRGLFMNFVPAELRERNTYREGETFNRSCKNAYATDAYPLHTGWLLAVAMYNAGPKQRPLVDYYFQIKDNNYPSLTPLDLIEALHWGGKYKKDTDNTLEFKDQAGDVLTQKWYKSCIVQRHVARVIQHVTLPAASIAKSLEQAPCSPDAPIPDYRKNSSGVK